VNAEVERFACLYHFYDPILDRFVNTGYSTLFGKSMEEYSHVNNSKKSEVNSKVTNFILSCFYSNLVVVFRNKRLFV
jgi:hypothetical protein